jgi:hypothetical protein
MSFQRRIERVQHRIERALFGEYIPSMAERTKESIQLARQRQAAIDHGLEINARALAGDKGIHAKIDFQTAAIIKQPTDVMKLHGLKPPEQKPKIPNRYQDKMLPEPPSHIKPLNREQPPERIDQIYPPPNSRWWAVQDKETQREMSPAELAASYNMLQQQKAKRHEEFAKTREATERKFEAAKMAEKIEPTYPENTTAPTETPTTETEPPTHEPTEASAEETTIETEEPTIEPSSDEGEE